jgi:hypothetical protein
MGLVMDTFRAGFRKGYGSPPRVEQVVYRVVLGPQPRPWLGSVDDLADTCGLSREDAARGLHGLMKRECVHVVGNEAGLRVFVLRALPR